MPKRKPAESPEKSTVGYGKPPAEYRFKPGRSGNPGGRAKGTISLARMLAEALAQRTTVRERGRVRKVSKLEAMTKTLADLAVKGDAQALRLLLNEMRLMDERAAEEPQAQENLTEADGEVIAALLLRIGGKA